MESQTRAIKSMYEALIKLPAGENARGGVSDACNLGFIDLKKKEKQGDVQRRNGGFIVFCGHRSTWRCVSVSGELHVAVWQNLHVARN